MSTLANTSNSLMRPYRHPTGSPPIAYYEEATCAATAVIRRGDIVSFDTVVTTGNHRVLRAPSSAGGGTNLLEVGVTSLLGIAAEASTGNGSTVGLSSNGARPKTAKMLGVYLAVPQTEFIGFVSSGGASTAVHYNHSSYVGQRKAVVYDRTHHNFFIDSTNSTAALAAIVITDVPSESYNDKHGALIFKFLSTNVAFNAQQ